MTRDGRSTSAARPAVRTVTLNVAVRAAGVALSLAALAACAAVPAVAAHPPAPRATDRAPTPEPAARGYTDRDWGFRIDVPTGWSVQRGFPRTYLANDAWKTYAAPDSRGVAIVALTLPRSNRITDAEIRIGASRNPRAVRDCTNPPSALRPGSRGQASIGGVTFRTFDAGDAAMSHYLDVRAYRAVHAGACYAIDLLVYGTNPAVYAPPATPPFDRREAFRRMHGVLQTFRFTR